MNKSQRILSLDVFRGIIIVLMILVNSPGTAFPYPILEHAVWHGCTLADLVFPSFLFIVGVTSAINLNTQRELKDKSHLYKAIFRRSLILFLLGMFLNVFPKPIQLDTLRIYGILQRIAVCYALVSILYLNTTIRSQILIFIAILVGYWVLMTQIPVPLLGANHLTKTDSWVSYFEHFLFSSNHLYGKTYDPEGFLTTIPAMTNTLCGVLVGAVLLKNKNAVYLIAGWGLVFLSLGWAWSYSFPLNKSLWTSSFVLWTCGFAMLTFALCFLIVDKLGYTRWAWFFKVFGLNAIFAFILHVCLIKLQFLYEFRLHDGSIGNLKFTIADYYFGSFSPANSSLLYSLSFLFLNFLVVWYLYRRKIFIKV